MVAGLVGVGCATLEPTASPGDAARRVLEGRERTPKSPDQPQDALEFFLKQRLGPGQDRIPVEHLQAQREAIVRREAALRGTRGTPTWTSLGPGNIGGRTRVITFDPVDPDVMYAAGVAGGVWKSLDAGASWNPLDDLMLNLAVCTIAVDPSDPNVVYAGTGEGYYLSNVFVRGLGIFKSVDAGATWSQLSGTVNGVPNGAFDYVNKIVISPNDSNRIYAATRTGIWRSVDAGQSWSVVLANPRYVNGPSSSNGSNAGATDLALRSDRDPDVLFTMFGIGQADGLFRSDDGGDSWVNTPLPSNQGRTTIAVAPSDNDVVYLLMADNGTGAATGQLVNLFRSGDGGATFTPQVDLGTTIGPWLLSNLSLATGCIAGGVYSQGWYDNALAVDPVDPDTVWVGGIDLFRSTDQGVNFEIASYWFMNQVFPNRTEYVHADQHTIVFHPDFDGTSNQTLFVGNDGGLFKTDNARAATSLEVCALPPTNPPLIVWEEMNNGYGVTQYYHGDAARDRDLYIGGAQDNGTSRVQSRTDPDGWDVILGGDGGSVAIDHVDSQIVFAEYQGFPNFFKSLNGGDSFFPVNNGITDNDGIFITPFAMDPSDPAVLWTGGQRIWRTTNSAQRWELVGPNLAGPNQLSAIAVSPQDGNVVYVGYNNGYVARTTDGLAASPSWTASRSGLRPAWISSVAVDPFDIDVAYATYSNYGGFHVYRTDDGGQNWRQIDGIAQTGVPDIPVHWLEVRPCNSQELFAATELGIFTSDDGGASWQPVNTGLAHTVVESLDFQDDDTLVAFTHGRGAYLGALPPCPSAPPLQEVVLAPGPGANNPPRIRAIDGTGSTLALDFTAYAVSQLGANVGAGAIGAGAQDSILTGPGPGTAFGPQVRGFDRDGTSLGGVNFYAYGTLKFGVRAVGGDIDGDGFAEILSAAGPGAVFGPHVRGWNHDGGPLGVVPGCSFFAYSTLRFGSQVAGGRLEGGSAEEILTGAGPGAVFGSHVRGFAWQNQTTAIPEINFFAFAASTHGAPVSAGDLDGDGFGEILAALGPSPSSLQTVRGWDYDGAAVTMISGGEVTPFTGLAHGAVPASSDTDGDLLDELLVGAGPDPAAPTALRGFDLGGGALTPIGALSVDLHGLRYGLNAAGADLGL